MNKPPIISIIIPVYNVEPYIKKCIQSLLDQCLENFEAIIVNDGTPDNSISIAKKLVNNDPRFIFLSKNNGGQASARNFGLDYAKGEYICFLDSDDYLSPNCLTKCVSEFEKNKDLEILIFGYNMVTENGCIIEKHLPDLQKYYSLHDILCSKFSINYSVWNKVYRAEIFKSIRFFENIIYEDKEILPKLLYKKNIQVINNYLYFYVIRDGSTMHSYNEKSLESYLCIYKEYEKFLKNHRIFKEYQSYYKYSYLYFCFYAELLQIIRYSENPTEKYQILIKSLDKEVFNTKIFLKSFSLLSPPFISFILINTCPTLLKPLYKLLTFPKKLKLRIGKKNV